MTKQLATIYLVTMLVIGLASPSVRSQADPFIASLRGISAVYVLVEDLPGGAKRLGLSKEAIQTDVELKLRMAGMGVVTNEEGERLPGAPHVYVYINLTDNPEAANVEVELLQNAQLERNGQYVPSVTTWNTDILLTHPTAQRVRDDVKDRVDAFLNAWLSVNPKK